MAKPKPIQRFRKPDHRLGSIQVRICGRRLRTQDEAADLICTFHPSHYPPHLHGSIVLTKEGAVIALIDNLHTDGTEGWQLVAADQVE